MDFVLYALRMMKAPLRHIDIRICPLESVDELNNKSTRNQDTTYFAEFFFADNSGI